MQGEIMRRKRASGLGRLVASEPEKKSKYILPKKTKASRGREDSAYPRSYRLDARTLERIASLKEAMQARVQRIENRKAKEEGRTPQIVKITDVDVLRKTLRVAEAKEIARFIEGEKLIKDLDKG